MAIGINDPVKLYAVKLIPNKEAFSPVTNKFETPGYIIAAPKVTATYWLHLTCFAAVNANRIGKKLINA